MDKKRIGKIVNTHGIKGELKVATDDDSLFASNETIYIKVRNDFVEYNIKSVRKHKNHLLIMIGEYDNINQVLKYKGLDVYAAKGEELYFSDLIGYRVVNAEVKIGNVEEIINNNAHDILVLDSGVMIPYVDAFIKEIDETDEVITVELIEGMDNED